MNRALLRPWITLAALFASGTAAAAPLALGDLDGLETYVHCRETCGAGRTAVVNSCIAQCPATSASWEKNQVAPIDRTDLQLARLEYWDGGRLDAICYENNAVIPKPQCGLAECLLNHTTAECADQDGDGIRAWQEAKIGTSDTVAQQQCRANAECVATGQNAFLRQCSAKDVIGVSICEDRAAGATAFHLVTEDVNDQEVLVAVYFDFSPTPTSILDIYLDYDATAVQLVDSRPLDSLVAAGKDLAVRQVGSTVTGKSSLRLIGFSAASSAAIPPGPVAELLFRRLIKKDPALAFSNDKSREQHAMAGPPTGTDYRGDLGTDGLWGNLKTPIGADSPNRLVMQYSFDDTRSPRSYAAVPSENDLCGSSVSCRQATATRQAVLLSEMKALQGGVTMVGDPVDGVSASGALMDGNADHLELPVFANGLPGATLDLKNQQYSLSTWFYAEPAAGSEPRQLLFSHNNTSENTATGLYLTPSAGADTLDLVWFQGDYRQSSATVHRLATGIVTRTWTHLGFAADPGTGTMAVYVNGEPSTVDGQAGPISGIPAASMFACPAFDPTSPKDVVLPLEGSAEGGHVPEVLLYASAQNNLFGLEQMDMRTLTHRTIRRLPEASAEEPSYSAVANKIVYSSNEGGNYEIWIAERDGSGARAITSGFGNTSLGMFARRPQWAPDATAILFESNAFSRDADDNMSARTYHLYFIPYTPAKSAVEVVLPSGGVTNTLDYPSLVAQVGTYNPATGRQPNQIDPYRLVPPSISNSAEFDVLWVSGQFDEPGNPAVHRRGKVLFTSSDQFGANQVVNSLVLPAESTFMLNAVASPLGIATPGLDGADVSAIAAFHAEPKGAPRVTTALLREAWVSYAPTSSYAVTVQDSADRVVATVTHRGTGYDPLCWDTSRDGVCQVDENKTGDVDAQGNPVCTVDDCFPTEIATLYLKFDSTLLQPLPAESKGSAALAVDKLNKHVEILPSYSSSGSYVRVGVTSPTNNTPIGANMDIAQITFQKAASGGGAAGAIVPNERTVRTQLAILDLEAVPAQASTFTINQASGAFSELLDAAFSPDGKRLALSVIQQARPTLLTTTELKKLDATRVVADGADKIITTPTLIDGLSWTEAERFYPCNWVGAFRDAKRGQYTAALRGALDELKVYNYARGADAFRSEAQRGHEALEKAGRAGQLPAADLSCPTGDSLQCPAYHVCDGTTHMCVVQTCNPSDPYACKNGQCTLAAMSDPTGRELGWVCSAECNVDSECFHQQCLNGPCRFCDATRHACSECRAGVQDYGVIKVDTVEGCPDQNSYSCQAGSCVTECYRTINGQAKYACDPATEYCKRGKCALLEWDWPDLSPMTLSGAGEVAYRGMRMSIASPQLYPVEIGAFGVDDLGIPPEMVVEAKSNFVNGGSWFELGRVLVYNLTRNEAKVGPGAANPNNYVLQTPYALTALRMRLVTPPLSNFGGTANGSLNHVSCNREHDPDRPDAPAHDCVNNPNGTRPNLGYALGTSRRDQLVACAHRAGCTAATYDPFRAPIAGVSASPPLSGTIDHFNDAPGLAPWPFDTNKARWPFSDLSVVPGMRSLDNVLADLRAGDPSDPYMMAGEPVVVITGVRIAGQAVTPDQNPFDTDRICAYADENGQATDIPVSDVRGPDGTTVVGQRRRRIMFGPAEVSNQRASFPNSGSPLLTFAMKNRGFGLLNCNFASAQGDATTAGITVLLDETTFGPVWNRKPEGSHVTETANGCTVDVGGKQVPCYEITDGDAVFDVISTEGDIYKTLDFSQYRSFGYPTEQLPPKQQAAARAPAK